MQTLDPNFNAALQAAPDTGIAPVCFFWIVAKNRTTGAAEGFGLWSGDQDISQPVQTPTGGTVTRDYYGGVNLKSGDIKYIAELRDEPLTIGMSQLAPAAQELARGLDPRMAYAEVHSTSRSGTVLFSIPQLQYIGIVDDVVINTPEAGGEGRIGYVLRSDLMFQLTKVNPAKSSDVHQKRRQAGDQFSKYSGVIKSRPLQWYKEE